MAQPTKYIVLGNFCVHAWQGYAFLMFIVINFCLSPKVRKTPEVQELRQWQREWREINRNIQSCVNDFWESKMPEKNDTTSPELEEKSE